MSASALYPTEEIKRIFESLPHISELEARILKLERGFCQVRVDYAERLVGNAETGLIHGGVITTLLDSAGGAAAFSLASRGSAVATLDLRIDYLTQAVPGEPLLGYAECYHQTRSVVFVRGGAYHRRQEELLANFNASFMVGSVGFAPDVSTG